MFILFSLAPMIQAFNMPFFGKPGSGGPQNQKPSIGMPNPNIIGGQGTMTPLSSAKKAQMKSALENKKQPGMLMFDGADVIKVAVWIITHLDEVKELEGLYNDIRSHNWGKARSDGTFILVRDIIRSSLNIQITRKQYDETITYIQEVWERYVA